MISSQQSRTQRAPSPLARVAARAQLTSLGLDKIVAMVERASTHKSDRFAEPEAEPAEVEAGWSDALAIHERQVGLKQELQAAEQAWATDPSEEAWQRIAEIQGRLSRAADADALRGA